jgi:hypothetical protein
VVPGVTATGAQGGGLTSAGAGGGGVQGVGTYDYERRGVGWGGRGRLRGWARMITHARGGVGVGGSVGGILQVGTVA